MNLGCLKAHLIKARIRKLLLQFLSLTQVGLWIDPRFQLFKKLVPRDSLLLPFGYAVFSSFLGQRKEVFIEPFHGIRITLMPKAMQSSCQRLVIQALNFALGDYLPASVDQPIGRVVTLDRFHSTEAFGYVLHQGLERRKRGRSVLVAALTGFKKFQIRVCLPTCNDTEPRRL